MSELSKKLIMLLNENKLTQKQAAAAIGITEAAMSRYLKGLREPKMNVIASLAQLLGTSTDYLVGISAKKHNIAHWVIVSDGWYPVCSECWEEPPGREMTRYCPNCGAKMETGK